MAIEKEMLKGIPEGELREWARINGCDLGAFDVLYAMWQEANGSVQETTIAEPSAE